MSDKVTSAVADSLGIKKKQPPLGPLGELPEGVEGPAEAVYHKEGEDYTDRSFAGTNYGSQDAFELKETIQRLESNLSETSDVKHKAKIEKELRMAKDALKELRPEKSTKERFKAIKAKKKSQDESAVPPTNILGDY